MPSRDNGRRDGAYSGRGRGRTGAVHYRAGSPRMSSATSSPPAGTGPPAGGHARDPAADGRRQSVQTVCLGWHWIPYRLAHGRRRGRAPVKPFPAWLAGLGRRAVADAYGDQDAASAYQPDVALVNFYDEKARMGMHADREERSPAPVVSLSLGRPASSGSATRRAGTGRGRMWSWSPGTCSCSAGRPGWPTTAFPGPSRAPAAPASGCRPVASTSPCANPASDSREARPGHDQPRDPALAHPAGGSPCAGAMLGTCPRATWSGGQRASCMPRWRAGC